MSSFFGKFRANSQTPQSPLSAASPAKKDPNAPQPTPLEKLLAADTGPIRPNGSDKFFGFENFGSTCYANSIIQCLYYSVPFREQVINFPARSPQDTLMNRATNGLPRVNTDIPFSPAAKAPFSPTLRPSTATPVSSPKKPGGPGQATAAPGAKPEENKDSPEYKKKMAMAAGPVLAMDYENSKSYGMTESLFTCLKDIFEAIISHRSRVGVVSPQKFLEILRRDNEMFRTAMHQDAHEFLNLLLNEVVENVEQYSKEQRQLMELEAVEKATAESDSGLAVAVSPVLGNAFKNAAQSTGWVHSLFEGTLTSETRCLTCENTSQRDEAFLDLSVDLEHNTSVTSCLRKFSEEEMLCERNKFHCDNCSGLQEAEKRMKVKRLPRILALHLKRFKYTEDLQRLQKLFHRVPYPYHLRLFNTTDDAEDPDRLYELYAVVVHIGGGAYHGHYVSIIKTEDRGWLLFDDEMVEPVDKGYVRNFFGGENNLACAYVLFYQETTEEAALHEQESEGFDAASAPVEMKSEPVSLSQRVEEASPNGHIYSPVSPIEEDDKDLFTSIDPTTTAPPLTSDSPPVRPKSQPPSEPPSSSSGFPLRTKWGDVSFRSKTDKDKKEDKKEEKQRRMSKQAEGKELERQVKAEQKEQERLAKAEQKEMEKQQKAELKELEKQQKAQQKEQEKQAKARRKEMEASRRDTFKQQEDEFRAAVAASKATAKEEASTRKSNSFLRRGSKAPPAEANMPNSVPVNGTGVSGAPASTSSGAPASTGSSDDTPIPPNTASTSTTIPSTGTSSAIPSATTASIKENGHSHHIRSSKSISGGLNRFRHSSISLRNKPKFWPTSNNAEIPEASPPPLPSSLPSAPSPARQHTASMDEAPLSPTIVGPAPQPFGPGVGLSFGQNRASTEPLQPEFPSKGTQGSGKDHHKDNRSMFGIGRKKSSMLGLG
ncbi:hypothetical protein JOL62DRAFT_410783 [Phyllosticta paracitricarpa]|uniref:Ubiquitin carboxyl-terminal hydrolase n=2 Tax=Phyllosticta TaxID=121621 RepID=A0ABR1MN29_9PEZI